MLSLLTNYFLHVGTGNESKIASFTEIPLQEEATREVLNAAFCVSASSNGNRKTTRQWVPSVDLYKHCFMSIFIFIRSRFSDALLLTLVASNCTLDYHTVTHCKHDYI